MEYKYRLVMFLNKKKTKDIDIVPINWLANEQETDTLLCKFMPGPYTEETRATLKNMILHCEEPLSTWPSYPVDLRGRACTYEEAEKKILSLEQKPYVYTTENEKNSKKRAMEDKKKIKFKSVPSKKFEISEKLEHVRIDMNKNFENSKASKNEESSGQECSSEDINSNSEGIVSENCSSSCGEEQEKIVSQNFQNPEASKKEKSFSQDQPLQKSDSVNLNNKSILFENLSGSSSGEQDYMESSNLEKYSQRQKHLNKKKSSVSVESASHSPKKSQGRDAAAVLKNNSSCSEVRETIESKNSEYLEASKKGKSSNKDRPLQKCRSINSNNESIFFENPNRSSSEERKKVESNKLKKYSSRQKHGNEKKISESEESSTHSPKKFCRTDVAAISKKNVPSSFVNRDLEDPVLNRIEEISRSFNLKMGELQAKICNILIIVKQLENQINRASTDEHMNDEDKAKIEEMDSLFPCKNIEDFQKLDEQISNDEQFRKKFVHRMTLIMNKKSNLRKNLGLILRTYLSRNLALSFTTVKAVPGKNVFSETKLYRCIKDAASGMFKEQDGTDLTEPTFKEAIRTIFNNAKDWDGQGNVRKKNATKN